MRTTEEILKRARIVEIGTNDLTSQKFAGIYRSAFKGLGMRFKEVREYEPSDDVRFIDWNVSARMGHAIPYSKIFEEERELFVYILADVSASNLFGTSQSKCEMINQLCADLALTSIKKYNAKAGLIIFDEKVENFIKPGKTIGHLNFMIETLSKSFSQTKKTNIASALQFLNNTVKKRSVVFILSDFISSEDYKEDLFILAKKHDVFGFLLFDEIDFNLPNAGLLLLRDLESDKKVLLDSSNKVTRNVYLEQFNKFNIKTTTSFEFAAASLLPIKTDENFNYSI